jgi:hypothetical protein
MLSKNDDWLSSSNFTTNTASIISTECYNARLEVILGLEDSEEVVGDGIRVNVMC